MIEKANFTLFSYFSDDLKDFIKKILRKKPEDRMTLEEGRKMFAKIGAISEKYLEKTDSDRMQKYLSSV